MQNPPSQLVGLEVLENTTGRSREPKSPRASGPGRAGEAPLFPIILRHSQVWGIMGETEKADSAGFTAFPPPLLSCLSRGCCPLRKGQSSWASPKFA